MGLGEWRSSQEEKPVNMKQANLAQKDNLSQSQLLHTQNDRQMKTQAAGKQVKASEGERERHGCSWNSSSGTMMQQPWSWKNMYAEDSVGGKTKQILSYFLVNFQNANHQCWHLTTPTTTGLGQGEGQCQNRRIYPFDKFPQHCSSPCAQAR